MSITAGTLGSAAYQWPSEFSFANDESKIEVKGGEPFPSAMNLRVGTRQEVTGTNRPSQI